MLVESLGQTGEGVGDAVGQGRKAFREISDTQWGIPPKVFIFWKPTITAWESTYVKNR